MDFRSIKPAYLFRKCHYGMDYKQAGDHVSYNVEVRGKRLYIWFQGSNEAVDWYRNFDFFRKPYKNMEHTFYVHRGFLAAWKEVEDIIKEKITSYKCNDIRIVGYSHGAALAVLCHEFCKFNRPDAKVLTLAFEPPRAIACFRLPEAVEKRFEGLYCFRNGKDIVTHVPPAILGYRHVGELIKMPCPKTSAVKCHYPNKVYTSLQTLEAGK